MQDAAVITQDGSTSEPLQSSVEGRAFCKGSRYVRCCWALVLQSFYSTGWLLQEVQRFEDEGVRIGFSV